MPYLYPKDDTIDKGRRKSKSTSVHAMKEYGEVDLWLILRRRNRWGSHLLHTTSVLHPGKEPSVTTESQAGWAPETVLTIGEDRSLIVLLGIEPRSMYSVA